MKALILGTNAGQADIIRYLKSNNWEVHACSHKQEGPGCLLADQFHLVNIIDVEEVSTLANKIKVDLVYSVSSDLAIKTVTTVSEKLKLPHFLNSEIIELFDKKELLRQFLNEKDICKVAYTSYTNLEDASSWNIFPCVVKPTDSQGQRGVQLIEDPNKYMKAVEEAIASSKSRTAIVEEYFQGVEFSSNIVVQSGELIVNEFTERYVHGKEYFGLPKGHGIPVRNIRAELLEEATSMISRMIMQLEIQDAILYVQMVATDKGVRIIEVAPRLDGCHIWRLIKTARGFDLRQYAIDALMGKKISHASSDRGNYSLYFDQIKAGLVFNKSLLPPTENASFHEYRYVDGEEVVKINGRLEVVGYYIVKD